MIRLARESGSGPGEHACAFLRPALGSTGRKCDLPHAPCDVGLQDKQSDLTYRTGLFAYRTGLFTYRFRPRTFQCHRQKKPYSVRSAAFGASNSSIFSPRFCPYAFTRARTYARKAYFYRNALLPFISYIPKTLDFIMNSPYL